MEENVSLQDVKDAVGKVMHPAIKCTLVELGIATDISLDGNQAIITLALPALGIPPAIINYFTTNLTEALAPTGLSVKFDKREMSSEEKQRFFSLEHANWKGL